MKKIISHSNYKLVKNINMEVLIIRIATQKGYFLYSANYLNRRYFDLTKFYNYGNNRNNVSE